MLSHATKTYIYPFDKLSTQLCEGKLKREINMQTALIVRLLNTTQTSFNAVNYNAFYYNFDTTEILILFWDIINIMSYFV